MARLAASECYPPPTKRNPKAILGQYREKRADKPFIAVDIETHGLGGAFAGGGYIAEDEATVTPFTSIDEWLAALFSRRYQGYIWYAHNGGEYDYKYLLEALLARLDSTEDMTITPIIQGRSRVIGFKIRYREHVYELRDSYALMPSSLEKLTRTLAPDFHKKEFDHDHTVFDITNSAHWAYLEMDVLGLRAVIQTFRALVRERFGVSCGWTAASTALRAWRATIPHDVAYFRYSKRVRDFCRQSYVGGLVALHDTLTHEDVVSVDTNAMYPYVMLQGVPVGMATSTLTYEPDRPGIYHVVVTVPDAIGYPTAPYRDAHTLQWASGTFETYMCSHDLEDIARDGVTWRVLEGYTFDHIAYPFQTFVTQCEALELAYEKGSAVYEVVKILRNSLYGKFGAREVGEEYVFTSGDAPANDEYLPVIDTQTGEYVDGLWQRPTTIDAPYLHPEWASWITASARVENRRVARLVSYDAWLYADTDSNKFAGGALRAALARGDLSIGVRYGQLKVDGEYARFQAGGPKFYWGVTHAGEVTLRGKGIPQRLLSWESMHAAIETNTVTPHAYVGMNGTLQMLKRGRAKSEIKTRSYPLLSHSAGWRLDESRRVWPIHHDPAQDILEASK